jgi:hypothetical protein
MISHCGYNELQLEWWEEDEKQGAFFVFSQVLPLSDGVYRIFFEILWHIWG